jgi:two-component system, NtrC family, response regulator AtoC
MEVGLPEVSGRVLIVQPDELARQDMTNALAAVGFIVTEASSFEAAKRVLDRAAIDVLLTELRLGKYNGLHLVIRAQSVRADVVAVIISPTADRVLQREADALGATFVLGPPNVNELRAAVLRTVHRDRRSTELLRPPFERRRSERRLTGHPVAEAERRVRDRRTDMRFH